MAFLARCDIATMGDVLGARLYSLGSPISRASPLPRREDALPVTIRLPTVRVALGELAGASSSALERRMTAIRTRTSWSTGTVVARGKVACYYEDFALRITEVTRSAVGDRPVRSSGYLIARALPKGKAKDFNFKRPDRFSSDTSRKIRDLHELFAQNLTVAVPSSSPYAVAAVDQATFGELTPHLRSGSPHYAVMRVGSHGRGTAGRACARCQRVHWWSRRRPRFASTNGRGS